MAQINFPSVARHVAQLETKMPTATLGEVRKTIEGLAAQSFQSGLIEAAFQRADVLNDREVSLNHFICDLNKELGDLEITLNRLAPLQIAEKLDALQQKILSCPLPSTNLLQKQLSALESKWNHLCFLYAFPDTEELNLDSIQNNVIHRLLDRIAELRPKNPQEADRLSQTLVSLQHQCHVAEEIFTGSKSAYRRLPESIRLDVEQRLFEKGLSLEGEPDVLAAAVMASLSDRMMDVVM